jgi:cell division protein FtsZ
LARFQWNIYLPIDNCRLTISNIQYSNINIMIHFDLPKEKSSIIKVIGVGGGGSNAVNHMFSQNIEGVNFIICNTDAQAISQSRVPNKIQLGPHLTQGLGAGANPSIGRQATEESLEEIKSILEVNTKMAFITAGMGGGTGTGGAPIISKICKDLGILTVGIVTTPFSYEGKKRQMQAEEGINVMKQYVDTLLVISNDKLRHQFGNLKMKEAFGKADNVLATAAKCITDVINSTGQINVDFADVCTVMRNGGVAILGSAAVGGENRAHKTIEEALTSPLLNDNDIRGAKWILININSAEGEHEFTMDEVEVIQNYLLSHAGEGTDVILGLGYDNSLGDKIGITLIATGFEYKDPFDKQPAKPMESKKNEKVLLPLMPQTEPSTLSLAPKTPAQEAAPVQTIVMEKEVRVEMKSEPEMEAISRMEPKAGPVPEQQAEFKPEIRVQATQQPEIKPELAPSLFQTEHIVKPLDLFTQYENGKNTVEKSESAERIEWVLSQESKPAETSSTLSSGQQKHHAENNSPASAASGGYLARPTNIYAEPMSVQSDKESIPVKAPNINESSAVNVPAEDPAVEMQLVFKDDNIPAAEESRAHQTTQPVMATAPVEEPAMQDEIGEQKRRAAERIQKLRNLSFNINAADPNNEFETVPAYIRRNLELYNTISNVENFYSNYEVKTDENNNTQISTINTFLDGKNPD